MITQQRLQGGPHGGIAMQGQEQGRIGVTLQHSQEALADLLQPLAPVLAAMHRRQDHALLLKVQTRQLKGRSLFGHQQQGVDHGVAGRDGLTDHARGRQVAGRHVGRGEVQQGDLGDQTAVGLLWVGIKDVVGAQSRLHMTDGDLLVERRQR